ncbi:hypothetical protein EJ08DRAFT_683948 [Tothia fuscella]|uniref:Galactose oxidase n=1 Tax=Tothia fuscella TaxID=1048955 RepID=A0A9P4NF51_9PEZI|nr:hypothetical protein EJ08DRAFT_683948 [Tothia fuscella]
MKRFSLLGLPAPLLLLLGLAHGDQLPYNPTRIFGSPQYDRSVYVLRPISASSSQCSLASLNISTLATSSLPYTQLFSTLPFLEDGVSTPINAVMDGGGNITILTGSCSSNDTAQLWRLSLGGKETGVGTWKQQNLGQITTAQAGGLAGPNFLATGISFSSKVSALDQDTKLYFFGGMCPTSAATTDSWMSSANYSSSMLTYTPKVAGNALLYTEGTAAIRTQPIPQAGHSITALDPTYSNKSDGTSTQQQDFVLLGGHIQQAFLNMSQVALFSLPQEAWTFFPVDQASRNGHSDLALRDGNAEISPRSGHTATLSSDGKKIILLGGWVGDVNTPAIPQLAILNVGAGYGGSGSWSWSIPSTPSGPGIVTNAGIYGHAAMLLPGDVLLVVGGYTMAAPTTSRRRRATVSQMLNTKAFLYNITSNTWQSDYSFPSSSAPGTSSIDNGPLSTISQKAGLGAGLGVGIAAVTGLLIFYLWYKRRLFKQRETREEEMRSLAYTSHSYDVDEWGMPILDGRFVSVDMYSDREKAAMTAHPDGSPGSKPGPPIRRSTSAQDAERTGLLVEIPSPTRGLRRNVPSRSSYTHEKRLSRNMDMENIHPIVERDEDDVHAAAAGASEMSQRSAALHERTSALLANAPIFDPYVEGVSVRSPLGSHPVSPDRSPETGRSKGEREQEVQGWVSEWEKAAEALISAPEMGAAVGNNPSTGRMSPPKSDRTSSTLSDQSSHSTALSYISNSGGGVTGIARTLSTRSAAFLNSLTSSFGGSTAGGVSPTSEKSLAAIHATLPSQQARASKISTTTAGASRPATAVSIPRTNTGHSHKNEGDSFTTARTSFAQLLAEGEALLSPSPQNPYSRNKSEPSSPIREKKGVSWVGSVKRAISGAYNANTTDTAAGRSTSLTAASARYSQTPSPTRPGHSISGPAGSPRRAASDAGFWKGRRGQRDWQSDPSTQLASTAIEAREADDAGSEEDDWDVEGAAEGRVVQLMFTVPRERLRVVNADVDGRSLISFDDDRGKIDGKGKERLDRNVD